MTDNNVRDNRAYFERVGQEAPPEVGEMMTLMPQLVTAIRGAWQTVPESVQAVLDGAKGLGPRHVRVLAQLMLYGPQSVSDLSKRLSLTLATTSLMVGELSQAGLVERREDPSDRRRTIVNVADAFIADLTPMLDTRVEMVARVISGLDPGERESFLKGLRLLITEIEAL